MRLLLAALTMVGCAVMMGLLMWVMSGGRGGRGGQQPGRHPDGVADERRAALKAEVEDLRAQLDERST